MVAGRRLETGNRPEKVESNSLCVDSREKVVKFVFGEFELRVNDLFLVEALNSFAKASFFIRRIVAKHIQCSTVIR